MYDIMLFPGSASSEKVSLWHVRSQRQILRPLCSVLNQHVCVFVRRTLQLARQLKDRAVEAQACYSLGNTYTLLQDYERAIDYHLKHLIIAQDLNDRYTQHTQSL